MAFQATLGAKGQYFFWPGIAVNRLGHVVVNFQRSSKTMFLTTGYSGKKARKKKFDAVRNLITGKCSQLYSTRTGDYVGAQTDPLDSLGFWISGEFMAKRTNFVASCTWDTRIANVRY